MPTVIRDATADDADTLHDLICALARYEREPDAVLVTPAMLRAQMTSARPPFECVIAERDGGPVGMALFFQTYSTWRGRPGMWLEDLIVLEEHRRHGAGAALLAHLAARAVARGYGRLEWSVLDWNTPAQAFYRSIGAAPLETWTTWRLTDDPLRALGGVL